MLWRWGFVCSSFPSNYVVYEAKCRLSFKTLHKVWVYKTIGLEDLPFMVFKVYLRSQKASQSRNNSTAAITVLQVSDIKDVFSSGLPSPFWCLSSIGGVPQITLSSWGSDTCCLLFTGRKAFPMVRWLAEGSSGPAPGPRLPLHA